jgi:uncharacterized protein (TIGR02996 family)
MNDHQSFLDSISADPADQSRKLVFSDWLEEKGETDAAFTMRWLAKNGKWPQYREKTESGNREPEDRYRWAWWKYKNTNNMHWSANAAVSGMSGDIEGGARKSYAVLGDWVFGAVCGRLDMIRDYYFYPTAREALNHLQAGLLLLRELIEV